MLSLVNGSQTIGNSRGFWLAFLSVLALALIYPIFADSYDVGNFSYFLIWIFMALGLSLIWGYGGMLSLASPVIPMACSRSSWVAAA
jgi:urea transport system permease protein